MPWLKALPTWLALNNVNSSSPSEITDAYTGQPIFAGGLNLGDYTDFDNDQAAAHSYTTNGILYEGRYRYVQVDSGATAAYVKTGTIGYARSGSNVKTAVITAAGSGQTNGTTNLNANPGTGGGSGAILSITISGGAITSVSVVNAGFGYVSPPTFTVAQGGTPGTVAVQLGNSVNLVTSYDVAVSASAAQAGIGTARPVVFLNSITPGNYGFVQELGTATVLGGSSFTDTTIGDWIDSTTNGVVTSRASTNSPVGNTVGRAIDLPVLSNLFKVILTGPTVQE